MAPIRHFFRPCRLLGFFLLAHVANPVIAESTSTTSPAPTRSAPPLTPITATPSARPESTAKTGSPKPVTAPASPLQGRQPSKQVPGPTNDKPIQPPAIDRIPQTSASLPKTELPARLIGSIRQVKPYQSQKLVALTFDLCEGANEKAGYDTQLVNYLRTQQVRATFFAGGKWMRSHPDKTLALMADPLFEIGNHTWTHGNLRVLRGAVVYDQINRAQTEYQNFRTQLFNSAYARTPDAKVLAHIPAALSLFRFPYGACSTESLAAVNKMGLAAIQWSIVTGDPAKGQTADRISRAILQQIQPGSIIVAHANGRGWHTAAALPAVVTELRKRGYEFVTVSELLGRGEVVAADSCYETKPGDNAKYDRLSKTNPKR